MNYEYFLRGILNFQQWVTIFSYLLLIVLSIGWIIRFRRYALYVIPIITVAAHGLMFYALYFVHGIPGAGTAIQIAWSPYLRIHSNLTFLLMMALMWDRMTSREKAIHLAADAVVARAVERASTRLNGGQDVNRG